MVCHARCGSFRSYLFFLSALGFLCWWWRRPAAPTPAPPAPTGPGQAPFHPRLMGGPPHPPLRATHRDALVSGGGSDGILYRVYLWSRNHKTYQRLLLFPRLPASSFTLFLHYRLNKNAVEITEVQLLPQSLDKSCLSDGSFNLYLKPGRSRAEVYKGVIAPLQRWREIIITLMVFTTIWQGGNDSSR